MNVLLRILDDLPDEPCAFVVRCKLGKDTLGGPAGNYAHHSDSAVERTIHFRWRDPRAREPFEHSGPRPAAAVERNTEPSG
jgi:hypothetical protein